MGAGFGSCKINVPRDMHREDFQFSTSRRQKLLSFTHGWFEDIEQSEQTEASCQSILFGKSTTCMKVGSLADGEKRLEIARDSIVRPL